MQRQNILVADDDPLVIQLLSSRLRGDGFNVIVAFDAMQAWMTAQRTIPAAVILDIQMPGGTGLEVLKKLKSSARTTAIPVVVVSASINEDVLNTVRELGADDFLPKPLDFQQLLRSLYALLGRPLNLDSKTSG